MIHTSNKYIHFLNQNVWKGANLQNNTRIQYIVNKWIKNIFIKTTLYEFHLFIGMLRKFYNKYIQNETE